MHKERETVLLAAKDSDSEFWDIQPFVQGCGVLVTPFFSVDELIDGLQTDALRPAAVFLSATCVETPALGTISRIRAVVENTAVVVAVARNTKELECEIRRAGIFYYMTLPTDRDEVEKVVLSALQARRLLESREAWLPSSSL